MNKIHYLPLLFSFALLLYSCKSTEIFNEVKSNKKNISSLSIQNIPGATSTFDASSNSYSISVPSGTNLKAIVLTLTLPTGATCSPLSGSVQDFTNPVNYTITAEDGSKQTFKITILVNRMTKSSEKFIVEFSFKSLNPIVKAIIDNTNKKINAEVPANTDLTKLIPTILISQKASVSPSSLVVQNFSSPILYEVTAEDGSKQKYDVQISKKTESGIGNRVTKFVRFEEFKAAVSNNDGTFDNSITADTTYIYYYPNGEVKQILHAPYSKDLLRNRERYGNKESFYHYYEGDKLRRVDYENLGDKTKWSIDYTYPSSDKLKVSYFNKVLNRIYFEYEINLDKSGKWVDIKNNISDYPILSSKFLRNSNEDFYRATVKSTVSYDSLQVSYSNINLRNENIKFWEFFSNNVQLNSQMEIDGVFINFPISRYIKGIYSYHNYKNGQSITISSEEYEPLLDNSGRVNKIKVTHKYKSDEYDSINRSEYTFFYN